MLQQIGSKKYISSSPKVHHQISLTQMSGSKGIKLFGDEALLAMMKEYQQLGQVGNFMPINALTIKQK